MIGGKIGLPLILMQEVYSLLTLLSLECGQLVDFLVGVEFVLLLRHARILFNAMSKRLDGHTNGVSS